MKMVENFLGKFTTDPVDPGQILDTGPSQALQTAKVLQQGAATLGPDTTDLIQQRSLASAAPAGTMAGDRKPMRFIANLLDQVQRR